MPRLGRWRNGALAAVIVASVAMAAPGAMAAQSPSPIAGPCVTETEPNNDLKSAPSLTGDACVSGALTQDDDQDLWLWEVSPEGSLLTWTFTMDGVPSTITSVHVLKISSAPGVLPVTVGTEVLRVDSHFDSRDMGITSDVHLDPGRYLLGISRGKPVASETPSSYDYQATITRTGALPPSGDVEPNEDATHASPVAGVYEVSGDVRDSLDEYAWTLSPEDAAHSWELGLRSPVGSSTYETLIGTDGQQLASAKVGPDGLAVIHDLKLPAGTYAVSVTPSSTTPSPYVIHSEIDRAAGIDPEPNDDKAHAVPLDPAGGVASGRLASSGDRDDYRLHVDATLAATQMDLHLVAGGTPAPNHELCLVDAGGVELQCRHGTGDLRLSDLVLPIGDYVVDLSGDASLDDGYQLGVEASGPRPADREAEPNDLIADATSFDPALGIRGRADGEDDDYFHVTIPGDPQLWRLDATGTALDSLDWVQRSGQVLASTPAAADGTNASLTDLYLIPGDHWFHVGAHDGDYSLALTPLGPPDPDGEREPNNDAVHAEPLDIGQTRTGKLSTTADIDVYRFSLAAPEHVVIGLTPPPDGAFTMGIESGGSSLLEMDAPVAGQRDEHELLLQPGDYETWLRSAAVSEATYGLSVQRADPFLDPGASLPSLPLTMTLTPSTTEVAGYISAGQRVDALLSVSNTGATDLDLALDAVTSNQAWTATPGRQRVSVAAGTTETVPVSVRVGPDAWAGIPVRVTVRAQGTGGAQQTAFTEITPTQDAAPIDPVVAWSVPDALLGGLDVASPALGGKPVPRYDISNEVLLYDGLALTGSGFSGQINDGQPVELTVDLAGEDAVPVAGIILDPLAGDLTLAKAPQRFELLLSADGVDYQTALTGEMSPQTVEQSFVLDAPVAARFARLRLISNWGDGEGPVTLGEWKVVATPGAVPTTDPLNIADPVRGGHIVWMEPQPGSPDAAEGVLTEDPTPSKTYLPAGTPIHWVTGFQDDRAAQVTRLEWVDPAGSTQDSLPGGRCGGQHGQPAGTVVEGRSVASRPVRGWLGDALRLRVTDVGAVHPRRWPGASRRVHLLGDAQPPSGSSSGPRTTAIARWWGSGGCRRRPASTSSSCRPIWPCCLTCRTVTTPRRLPTRCRRTPSLTAGSIAATMSTGTG